MLKTLYHDYDKNGRLQKIKEDEKGLTEYAYTEAGRIKEIRTLEGFCTSYEYDSDGNISHLMLFGKIKFKNGLKRG